MSIYVGGDKVDYSALKGPCPDGFHVPASTEWQGLKSIMDGLSLTTGNNWRINLHIPFAGIRYYSSGNVGSQGGTAYYWSSSGDTYPRYAWGLTFNSGMVNPRMSGYRAAGQSLRCFKDSYAEPTASWTIIQGTLGSAGIFWNQSEGLISITDGSTGYTIMDKNLGATTVYNDGDTLSEANCGKYYQWGNNYGFPWTGSITTSTTQVDTNGYGPTNPYSSDTFIIGNDNRSSVQNDNLWGGVTGVRQIPKKVKEIYVSQQATPRLPDEYQEIKYIESGTNGGTQFIQFTLPYYDNEGYYSFEVDAGNVGNAEGMLITFRQGVLGQ